MKGGKFLEQKKGKRKVEERQRQAQDQVKTYEGYE